MNKQTRKNKFVKNFMIENSVHKDITGQTGSCEHIFKQLKEVVQEGLYENDIWDYRQIILNKIDELSKEWKV